MKGSPALRPHPSPRGRRDRRGLAAIWAVLGVLALALLLGGGCAVSKYNGMVADQEGLEKHWSEVLNQYERRTDLVPQLVATVKGAANFEQETITQVTEARASVGKVQVSGAVPEDAAEVERFMEAQRGLSSALSRLLVVAENYPELRATQAFRDLQSQLEGNENRIAVARRDYIDAVQRYNTNIRKFPNSFIASSFGFERVAQLEPDEEKDVTAVPVIDFEDE